MQNGQFGKDSTKRSPDAEAAFLAADLAACRSCMITFSIRSKNCWLDDLLVNCWIDGSCSSRPRPFTFDPACTTTKPPPNLIHASKYTFMQV